MSPVTTTPERSGRRRRKGTTDLMGSLINPRLQKNLTQVPLTGVPAASSISPAALLEQGVTYTLVVLDRDVPPVTPGVLLHEGGDVLLDLVPAGRRRLPSRSIPNCHVPECPGDFSHQGPGFECGKHLRFPTAVHGHLELAFSAHPFFALQMIRWV